MSDVNDEMKAVADYAIKSAKERFKQDLDLSEESIVKLDNILGQIYWGFSGHGKDVGEGGVIFNTAIIWGSYLGEYMRLKWGGTWVRKGSDTVVSIINTEFSPISLVYQIITSHPEYSAENYLVETKRIIDTSALLPQQPQNLFKNINQLNKQISVKPTKKPVKVNKDLLLILGGIGGSLLVIIAFIIGYINISQGGLAAFGLFTSATSTNTSVPTQMTLPSATAFSTDTPSPTVTPLPTYTAEPTVTPLPTNTPSPIYTQTATVIPTDTPTPFVPTNTRAPSRTPTATVIEPTQTREPPTQPPPPPTATQPAPIVVESCDVNPSTVARDVNTQLTFTVQFSGNTPGYGFEAVMNLIFDGQSGCVADDDDGNGNASCDGTSGVLPGFTTVKVTFVTPVGDCVASYSSE